MAKFLTRRDVSSYVEHVTKDAKYELVLVSPYLELSDDLFARLREADKSNVDIRIIYRNRDDEELKASQIQKLEDEIQRLRQLRNVTFARLRHLHAKCYYNENCMVITSMNLYDYSEKNNWEMGLLIQKEQDGEVFIQARKEAESMFDAADKVKSRRSALDKVVEVLNRPLFTASSELKKPKDKSSSDSTKPKGFCIRCGKHKSYNTNFPYCRDCYREWEKDRNRANIENFCHGCGNSANISVNEPLCSSCRAKSRR